MTINVSDAQKNSVHKLVHELRKTYETKEKTKDRDPLTQIKLDKINSEINRCYLSASKLPTTQAGYYNKGSKILGRGKSCAEYLRKGLTENQELLTENGSLEVPLTQRPGLNSYGSYSIADHVHDYLQQFSILRQLASTVVMSRDAFDMVATNGDVGATWGDGSTIAPPSENFVKKTIKTFDLTAQPRVTQRMIDDVEIDIEKWIAEQLAMNFLVKENEAFLNGDGINKPKGILSYAPGIGADKIKRIGTGDPEAFTVDGLMNLYYSLSDFYTPNACFIMHKSTVQTIRTFKDTAGQYLWMPGIIAGKADTLMGVPLYTSNNMPTAGADKDLIIYGDIGQAYQIVDRGGLTIQRDPYSLKPFVIFCATKRVGGDVINTNAISILRQY